MARPDLVPPVNAVVLYKRVDGGGLRLNPWQWGFAMFAPLLLIIIDLKLLGGWLMQMAPAAFWTAALVGWIPLALSQRRWHTNFDIVLNGMLAACAVLALLGAVSPILVFFVGRIGDLIRGAATFDEVWKSVLLSGIALVLTWPLILTAAAFRRQVKLRVRWRPDLRSRFGFIGMVVIPALMLVAETADRMWFSGVEAKLNAHKAELALAAAHDLRFYPVTLMTKTDEVCSALYAQGHDAVVDPEAMRGRLALAWGESAPRIEDAARKVLGPDATLVCADALSSGPF